MFISKHKAVINHAHNTTETVRFVFNNNNNNNNKIDPRLLPFKVTQGHRNRHGSIGYL